MYDAVNGAHGAAGKLQPGDRTVEIGLSSLKDLEATLIAFLKNITHELRTPLEQHSGNWNRTPVLQASRGADERHPWD